MTEETNTATISFFDENDQEVKLSVIEQTTINGINYLLVTDEPESDEADAVIMKETSPEGADEAVYDIVEDDRELKAIAAVFSELLEDVEIK